MISHTAVLLEIVFAHTAGMLQVDRMRDINLSSIAPEQRGRQAKRL